MTKFKQQNKDYLYAPDFTPPEEIMACLLEAWRPRAGIERIPLSQAAGRLCAEPLYARHTLPVCRVAGPDGIAVRATDFTEGMPDTSRWREGVDYVAADCGDDFADGFDTVINIERVSFPAQGGVRLDLDNPDALKKGDMVRPRGATLHEGEQLLAPGNYIGAWQTGVLASAGISEVAVIRKPVIAFIPTGSELITPNAPLTRGKNIEANGMMLRAALNAWGAELRLWPIVRDVETELEQALDSALAVADIVLPGGGSSMGSEDFSAAMLARRATRYRHGVRCAPGKPAAVALIDGKAVINLPGPPLSAFCALDWSLKPLLAAWYGQPVPARRRVMARLTRALRKPSDMMVDFTFYCRLQVFTDSASGKSVAQPLGMDTRFADSAMLTNALIRVPPGIMQFEAGRLIEAEILYTDTIPSPLPGIPVNIG
jgi:molybdopterin molybdotransferase